MCNVLYTCAAFSKTHMPLSPFETRYNIPVHRHTF